MKTIRPRKMRSSALDLLQHLEHALGSVDEKTLEGLAKAAALQRIAPGAFDFGHVDLLKGGGRIEQNGAFYQRSADHKPQAVCRFRQTPPARSPLPGLVTTPTSAATNAALPRPSRAGRTQIMMVP